MPPTEEAVQAYVDNFGPPPAAFSSVAAPLAVRELPLVERKGELYDVLLRRRTTRSFDRDDPLALSELAVVLRYVFGYHGYAPLLGQVTTLKRTSPSAGGFHPIEAYAVIMAVDEPRARALPLQPSRARARADGAPRSRRCARGGERVRLRSDLLRRRPRPDRARGALRARVLEVPEPPQGVRRTPDGCGAPEPDALSRRNGARARGVRHRCGQQHRHRRAARNRRISRGRCSPSAASAGPLPNAHRSIRSSCPSCQGRRTGRATLTTATCSARRAPRIRRIVRRRGVAYRLDA